MIKMLAPALRHPTNRDPDEFRRYWEQSHGPLFSNTRRLRRYVQHITMGELAGDDEIRCTYDGCSMFWYDGLDDLRHLASEPFDVLVWEATMRDDRQLFDRSTQWPPHNRFVMIIAEERVVVDEPAKPGMVKVIRTLSRAPGLTPAAFDARWSNEHAALVGALPVLRRYVQNPALVEAHTIRGMTHDGWSELWFDDLESFRLARRSPQWAQLTEASRDLFAEPIGLCVARERIQKEFDTPPRRWATGLSPSDIANRLAAQGYTDRVTDYLAVDLADRLAQADSENRVAVWTDEHLVLLTEPPVDLRPITGSEDHRDTPK